MAYPPLSVGSADELERSLLERWKEEDLFRRTLEANREGTPYVFYEGPPTANGRPGIHHVFARTIKDLVCRFHAMQGQSVTRIAGWDTHGLPVEIEVEKELKLNGKKAIEAFGVEEFNARARQSVFKYQGEWESLSDRIAYWLDYVTERFTQKPKRGRINLSYVTDAALEDLLDKQRSQFNLEERLQTVKQIEEHVAEEQYEIYFSTDSNDPLLVATCASSPCAWTDPSGAPLGTTLHYVVRASDVFGNWTQTDLRTLQL